MIKPKSKNVLIISHNPLSDLQNNGKTLSSFLEGWPKNKLAQLYLTTDVPSFRICDRYFRITDLEILRSFVSFRRARGAIVGVDDADAIASEKVRLSSQPIYSFIRNIFQSRSPFAYFIRSIMWSSKRWWSPELEIWLNEFSPDVVFFQSSNCSFAFDIVKYLCIRYKLPLIMETTDDYVTPRFSINPFYWFEILRLRKRFSWAVKYSETVIAIGDKMACEYHERFGGKYIVAMNSVSTNKLRQPMRSEDGRCIFLYAGNLGLNRWKVLLSIGKSLARINQIHGNIAELRIYSLEPPSSHIQNLFRATGSIKLCGSADNKQLATIRQGVDILVHVESFDKKNIAITRLSVSTKIPECMASGRCLLAVGPCDVASMQYVKRFKIGMQIDSLQNEFLDNSLWKLISNIDVRIKYINNAFRIVEERHNNYKTRRMIEEIIDGSSKK